jgi:hypothetical protein
MTHIEMQQAVLDNISEGLQDTIDIRNRISIAFGRWFREKLAAAAPAPTPMPAPAPDAGGVPMLPEGAPPA